MSKSVFRGSAPAMILLDRTITEEGGSDNVV
jgi:hypothetical protein